MKKISKDEYLLKCKELLDYCSIDYSGAIIYKTSGGNNKTIEFASETAIPGYKLYNEIKTLF